MRTAGEDDGIPDWYGSATISPGTGARSAAARGGGKVDRRSLQLQVHDDGFHRPAHLATLTFRNDDMNEPGVR